jgi:xylan 1,4-beta-xylosidase
MRNKILASVSLAKWRVRFAPIVLVVILISGVSAWPQETPRSVQIDVHANQSDGALAPIWTYFGYDESNYSYATNGRKLLSELSALSPAPVYVRVHNLLTSGDGSSSLK